MYTVEINDMGIGAAGRSERGAIVIPLEANRPTSPGYAWISPDGQLHLGAEAAAVSRSAPQQVCDQFWHKCSTEASRLDSVQLSHADLVQYHLQRTWQMLSQPNTPTWFLTPAGFRDSQRTVLAHLADNLRIPIAGMMHGALGVVLANLAIGTRIPDGGILVLDLQRHSSSVVRLEVEGRHLTVRREAEFSVGGKEVEQVLLQNLAADFTRLTRFDPLYSGKTSQQLYDQIDPLLDTLVKHPESRLHIQHGDALHHINVARQDLELHLAGFITEVTARLSECLDDRETRLLLSPRCLHLPGLSTALETLPGLEIIPTVPRSIPRRVLKFLLQNPNACRSASTVTAVAWREQAVVPVAFELKPPSTPPSPLNPIKETEEEAADHGDTVDVSPSGKDAGDVEAENPAHEEDFSGPPPTHIVYRGEAWPLNGLPFHIGRHASPDGEGIVIKHHRKGVSRRHCHLIRDGEKVLLVNTSTFGTFLNGQRIQDSRGLQIGDEFQLCEGPHCFRLIRVRS